MCAPVLWASPQCPLTLVFPTHLCSNVTACFSGCAPARSGSGRVLRMRTSHHLLICGRTSGVCLPPSLTPSTSPQTACTPSSSRAMPECLALKRVLELEFGLRDLLSRRQGCWLGKQHEACGQRHPQVHFHQLVKLWNPVISSHHPGCGLIA